MKKPNSYQLRASWTFNLSTKCILMHNISQFARMCNTERRIERGLLLMCCPHFSASLNTAFWVTLKVPNRYQAASTDRWPGHTSSVRRYCRVSSEYRVLGVVHRLSSVLCCVWWIGWVFSLASSWYGSRRGRMHGCTRDEPPGPAAKEGVPWLVYRRIRTT